MLLPIDIAGMGIWDKVMNHRCPKRVVTLINKIRSTVDKQVQRPRMNSGEGLVRFFIFPSDADDKPAIERAVAKKMASLTSDGLWERQEEIKCLTLEHRMAARRMHFLEMFAPLHNIESFRTGLLDGTLPLVVFFSSNVLPLVLAHNQNDKFLIARIVRERSPLLTSTKLEQANSPGAVLDEAQAAVNALMALWHAGKSPRFLDVLESVNATGLFAIPDSLLPSIAPGNNGPAANDDDESADPPSEVAVAIDEFLSSPFSQLEAYVKYVSGLAPFDTHQGVKGREFPRVMVIMDDNEARGFTFKFDKLFGSADVGDKTVEATKRLLYVTCSRAEKSLVLIGYTGNPSQIRNNVLRDGWFSDEEAQVGL